MAARDEYVPSPRPLLDRMFTGEQCACDHSDRTHVRGEGECRVHRCDCSRFMYKRAATLTSTTA